MAVDMHNATCRGWQLRLWAFWGSLASAIALAQLRGELPVRGTHHRS